MDPLSHWPDGSVKFAAVSVAATLCPNSQLPILLSKATSIDPVFPNTPVAFGAVDLKVNINFTSGQYSGAKTIDLGAALNQALASSSPDYWLKGGLVSQVRVDVPLSGGPLHLTADISRAKDGSVNADVQFNNDLTTIIPGCSYCNPGPLSPQVFSATVSLNGVNQSFGPITQYQYQNWHTLIVAAGSSEQFNVQHDLRYLQFAGAVLPYDRATGVNNSLLLQYVDLSSQPGFGAPLAVNGVTQYMPMTGGRGDIGYTTAYNTVWLMTQDVRAAKVALAQGDTAGAVPWNYRLASGHYVTPVDSPQIWVDGRSDSNGTTLANQPSDAGNWTPDTSHEPNLSYIPYLMTAKRWYLDRLYAQAAFSLDIQWPYFRCGFNLVSTCDLVIQGYSGDQIRGQAWSIREVMEAGFIAKTGSYEASIFPTIADHNWTYWQSTLIPTLTAKQGQTTGWLGSHYAEWQEDFMTGIVQLAAMMGSSKAKDIESWQRNWLAGRFIGQGMNPHDGCTYAIQTYDANGNPYTTWSALEAATVAAGSSNGTGWANSGGYYCALARAVLGGGLTLFPGDTNLQQALNWLNSSTAPFISQSQFQVDPTFNIVPLK
jgi:hypothetical protein